jgi:hypothetical protein
VLSFRERLHQAQAELAACRTDPWRGELEDAVRGVEAISTVALMDLLGCPKTTGSARRIAKVMRSMNFVPLMSRRLTPGGFRSTVSRGWARPLRGKSVTTLPSGNTGAAA